MNRHATPRSILKHRPYSDQASEQRPSQASQPPAHPGPVRFPSSPKLSTVHLTHCPVSYDRRPIVVLPNSLALPERNCPSYSAAHASSMNGPAAWSKHAHPSIMGRSAAGSPDSNSYFGHTYTGGLSPPPLSHDDGSGSSEESDGIASPPPETTMCLPSRQYVPSQAHMHSDPLSHPPIPQSYGPGSHYHASMLSRTYSTSSVSTETPTDYALAFLPHAPPASCSRKRDKAHARTVVQTPAAFAASWGGDDESSCLGGF